MGEGGSRRGQGCPPDAPLQPGMIISGADPHGNASECFRRRFRVAFLAPWGRQPCRRNDVKQPTEARRCRAFRLWTCSLVSGREVVPWQRLSGGGQSALVSNAARYRRRRQHRARPVTCLADTSNSPSGWGDQATPTPPRPPGNDATLTRRLALPSLSSWAHLLPCRGHAVRRVDCDFVERGGVAIVCAAVADAHCGSVWDIADLLAGVRVHRLPGHVRRPNPVAGDRRVAVHSAAGVCAVGGAGPDRALPRTAAGRGIGRHSAAVHLDGVEHAARFLSVADIHTTRPGRGGSGVPAVSVAALLVVGVAAWRVLAGVELDHIGGKRVVLPDQHRELLTGAGPGVSAAGTGQFFGHGSGSRSDAIGVVWPGDGGGGDHFGGFSGVEAAHRLSRVRFPQCVELGTCPDAPHRVYRRSGRRSRGRHGRRRRGTQPEQHASERRVRVLAAIAADAPTDTAHAPTRLGGASESGSPVGAAAAGAADVRRRRPVVAAHCRGVGSDAAIATGAAIRRPRATGPAHAGGFAVGQSSCSSRAQRHTAVRVGAHRGGRGVHFWAGLGGAGHVDAVDGAGRGGDWAVASAGPHAAAAGADRRVSAGHRHFPVSATGTGAPGRTRAADRVGGVDDARHHYLSVSGHRHRDRRGRRLERQHRQRVRAVSGYHAADHRTRRHHIGRGGARRPGDVVGGHAGDGGAGVADQQIRLVAALQVGPRAILSELEDGIALGCSQCYQRRHGDDAAFLGGTAGS
eukprot:ctg_2388.g340